VRANLVDGLFGPDTGVRVVQVLDGEQVAALATVSLLYPAPGAKGQLFMKDLFVRAAWRGQGLGEALMRWLARYAIEQGCVRFDWTTETGNPAAIAFYEQLGAARVTEKVYFRLTAEALNDLAT
jgi:GNAT superfamily N-acetyltransferase